MLSCRRVTAKLKCPITARATSLLPRRYDGDIIVPGQFSQHPLEILGFAKIAVDRGEPHIGDIVEIAQVRHHGFPDGLGGDFVLAEAFKIAHDPGNGLLDAIGIDIALAHRNGDRARELVAVERNAAAVALDDDEFAQLHALEGGEAEPARKAQPPPPDRRRIFGRTGVLHLGIETRTRRTAHHSLVSSKSETASRLLTLPRTAASTRLSASSQS